MIIYIFYYLKIAPVAAAGAEETWAEGDAQAPWADEPAVPVAPVAADGEVAVVAGAVPSDWSAPSNAPAGPTAWGGPTQNWTG